MTDAIAENLQIGTAGSHFLQDRIICIQEYGTSAGIEKIIEAPLGSLYTLYRAESQKVGLAHISDETIVRQTDSDKFQYVVRMVGAHLDNGNLSVGSNAQQGQRDTDVIVQVASCGSDIVLCRQDPGDKFLGRGLSVRPCKSDDCQRLSIHTYSPAVMACQLLKRSKGVRDREYAWVSRLGRI